MIQTDHVDNVLPKAHAIVAAAARVVTRYGLVLVIGWTGLLKFTSYEAHAIEPLVANSPVMSWLYDAFSVTTFSALLGVFEVVTALLIAVKPWAPKLSAFGGLLAVLLFLSTLSFLFTTPGVGESTAGGFPILSLIGIFLLKDAALLGVSLWSLSDSWESATTSADSKASS